MRRQQRELVYVEVPLVQCPGCGIADEYGRPRYIRQQGGGVDQGDGSRRRPMVCGECGRRFHLVVERPEIQ